MSPWTFWSRSSLAYLVCDTKLVCWSCQILHLSSNIRGQGLSCLKQTFIRFYLLNNIGLALDDGGIIDIDNHNLYTTAIDFGVEI